jgi:hypothetical protein
MQTGRDDPLQNIFLQNRVTLLIKRFLPVYMIRAIDWKDTLA